MFAGRSRGCLLVKGCAGLILLLVAFVVMLAIWWYWPYSDVRAYVPVVAGNGNRLVDAIDRFTAKNGRPPERLDVLVPDYIDEIPRSGFPRCQEFTYNVWEKDGVYAWHLSIFCEAFWSVMLDADEIACWSQRRGWAYYDN